MLNLIRKSMTFARDSSRSWNTKLGVSLSEHNNARLFRCIWQTSRLNLISWLLRLAPQSSCSRNIMPTSQSISGWNSGSHSTRWARRGRGGRLTTLVETKEDAYHVRQ